MRSDGRVQVDGAAALDARDVRVVLGRVVALDDVRLRVESGRCVALVGESGAGKTTLLRCFNRMAVPTSGAVRVGDDDRPPLRTRLLRTRGGRSPGGDPEQREQREQREGDAASMHHDAPRWRAPVRARSRSDAT